MKILMLLAAMLIPLLASAGSLPRLATDAEIAAAREGLQEKMLDADSAKFRDVRFRPSDKGDGGTICGLVNAKNSFGAYTGFHSFVVFVEGAGDQMKPNHPGVDRDHETFIGDLCKITMS